MSPKLLCFFMYGELIELSISMGDHNVKLNRDGTEWKRLELLYANDAVPSSESK